MFSPTAQEPLKQFQEIVDSLTTSKESIQRATKLAIENPDLAKPFVDTIRERVRQVSPKKRLALFYLLDSIAQNGNKSEQRDFLVEQVGNSMQEVIAYVIEHPSVSTFYSGVDNSSQVEKAVTIWKARDIFSAEVVRAVLHIVETVKQLPRQHTSAEEERILRKIEEIRREQKTKQQESSLRPLNEEPYAEMEELFLLIPVHIPTPPKDPPPPTEDFTPETKNETTNDPAPPPVPMEEEILPTATTETETIAAAEAKPTPPANESSSLSTAEQPPADDNPAPNATDTDAPTSSSSEPTLGSKVVSKVSAPSKSSDSKHRESKDRKYSEKDRSFPDPSAGSKRKGRSRDSYSPPHRKRKYGKSREEDEREDSRRRRSLEHSSKHKPSYHHHHHHSRSDYREPSYRSDYRDLPPSPVDYPRGYSSRHYYPPGGSRHLPPGRGDRDYYMGPKKKHSRDGHHSRGYY